MDEADTRPGHRVFESGLFDAPKDAFPNSLCPTPAPILIRSSHLPTPRENQL